jgi:microcompartment protein CcmK/EutM
MTLCTVVGTVTSTAKHRAFDGLRLMVVQPIDEHRAPVAHSFIAVDRICSAGVGDTVLVLREGNGVRGLFRDNRLPIRSMIVGVVDEVDS